MNRSTLLLWLLLSCAVACSRKTELNTLGLQYEPPSGMALLTVEPGPPAVARFEGGLELRSVEGSTPKVTAPPEGILASAGVPIPGKRLNSTDGTLPAGPVARYEFQQGTSRTLMYLLPLENRFVLVLYTAPERDYGPGSARVERSLSTLMPTR
ncbi:hypothetical protein [Archangium lansingense]|uniref:Lipoprotein n=1 Tax=Archangium lansingense TaxID=2995310 RepID=A0ABT4A116_9BACT|nr:hypothetical protein [Archangium lansinium]MCY1075329.1 hypothetical protein [Archangium lansinium]